MDEKMFWRQKLIQYFHDPLNKPYTGYSKAGSQKSFIRKYSELFLNKAVYLGRVTRPADWIAAGADRPYFHTGKGGMLRWYQNPLVFHPLVGGHAIRLSHPGLDEPQADAQKQAQSGPFEELKQVLELQQQEIDAVQQALAADIEGWSNEAVLKEDYLVVWRRLREALTDPYGEGNAVWELLPADTRSPDHTLWDHLKVTAGLCFMLHQWNENKDEYPTLPSEREPWMLRMGIGPVGRFIGQARTGRDLWVSSYLLSDLIWQAVQVVAERYGPDAIVYPDLYGNPRADCWLKERHRKTLPQDYRPNTFAAVIPNNFVALVPRGGADHLKELRLLAKEAQQAVNTRWDELQQTVLNWLKSKKDLPAGWESLWARQHSEMPLRVTWSAVPWPAPQAVPTPAAVDGMALPAQREDIAVASVPQAIAESEERRQKRLDPWVPPQTCTAYAQARRIFINTTDILASTEEKKKRLGFYLRHAGRGFDYALTHHQLSARHALRNQIHDDRPAMEEIGEKCTLCHERQALTLHTEGAAGLRNQRQAARAFWQALDPDGEGRERLCAVCATKRYLVEAGFEQEEERLTGITPLWSGYDELEGYSTLVRTSRTGPKLRLPFPSTSAIAAQVYSEVLYEHRDQLHSELAAVAEACRDADRSPTAFPEALPRLHHISRDSRQSPGRDKNSVQRFFEYDPQDTLFPTTLEGEIQRYSDGDKAKADRLRRLQTAVSALRRRCRQIKDKTLTAPATRIAVIKLDGDRMGALLRGDSESMSATWEDIIHPDIVDRIRDETSELHQAGWPELLPARRLMGPSVHAFLSRAMANYVHRIVPWVVEREFGGRLIYAGGDDVLCIAPAQDALDLAARLRQLWCAPWVVDSRHSQRPAGENGFVGEWDWRLPQWSGTFNTDEARRRFAIPATPQSGHAITLPITERDSLRPHVSEPDEHWPERWRYLPPLPLRGPLLPMPGGAATLSAGIVFGHFKTHLGYMTGEAERLLKEVAKKQSGRDALAVGLCSRNGVKAEFALKWSAGDNRPTAHRRLQRVREAFAEGVLPGRLPYKLRESAEAVAALFADEQHDAAERVLKGILDRALETEAARKRHEDLQVLWREGFTLHPKKPARSVEGLLLCRTLASAGAEEED